MPDLAALRANAARMSFDYGGARFTAYYRFADVDDRTHQGLLSLRAGDMEPFYAELERLVVAWDATENGTPVPCTADGFKRAGLGICGSLFNALLDDVRNPTVAPVPAPAPPPTPSWPGSREAGPSDGTPSPTTTPSSSTPNGSASRPGSWPDSPARQDTPAGSSGSTA